jgi:putative transposase
VDVKWDPDDMWEITVQDPVTKQWIDAQCRWSEYARGLSYNQHKLIKAHARQHLRHPDQQMALHRSQMELHDHWLDSTRGRKRADSLKAARYAGYTSSRVLQPIEISAPVEIPSLNQQLIIPQKLQISSEIEAEKEEIPTFESFVMSGGSL